MGGKMSKGTHEQDSSPSYSNSSTTGTDYTRRGLDADTARETAKYLPLKEIAALARTSRANRQVFQPILNEAKAVRPLLNAVVLGNPDELARMVAANPGLFFKKGQVTDPDGTIFYDVSPDLLISFLADNDMRNKIEPLIPEAYKAIRRQQHAEIVSGGADLIKMDKDPTSVPFEEVTRFKTSYDLPPTTEVTFSLLENPDGIIFYNNQFYYANQKTKTVAPIEPVVHSQQEQTALKKLKASFTNMENNSSRRSNNAEHQLIAHTMHYSLERKGVAYERKGVHYCDSHADFNQLLNAYRKCIRLYREQKRDEGENTWRREVGGAQRNVMWLLQRYCEENRPFYPLPDFKASPFRRGFNIYNFDTRKDETMLVAGALFVGFGSNFGIYKTWHRGTCARRLAAESCVAAAAIGLIAAAWLVKDAKANVVEFIAAQDLQADNAQTNLHPGPG